jgi:sugar (pentulose or hexulose) kinase
VSTSAIVVLDVGKTLSKVSLYASDGRLIERRVHTNARVDSDVYLALDTAGVERFLADTLSDFARLARVTTIVPIGHGAAAAIVRKGELTQPPLDYEHVIPAEIQEKYAAQREPFTLTGSPRLPNGLNLGAQLHYLQTLNPQLLANATLMPWPQYWSWRLCGVAASEVTSLACHTDLWYPLVATPSTLALARGWALRMAPRRGGGEVLGMLSKEWVERTGLSPQVRVHCGLHDSNAALLAARSFPELADHDATVLSTGTWFIAMRTPRSGNAVDVGSLAQARDCLVNVDAYGQPIPSARFMGGREIELLTADTQRIDSHNDQAALVAAVADVLIREVMYLPTLSPGCGPYGNLRGRWSSEPSNDLERRAAVCLYAALVADSSLDLIGARDRLIVEGRFADSQVFVRALATLRPDTHVYVSQAQSDVAVGALRLLGMNLDAPSPLTRVEPLAQDLRRYRERWRHEIEQAKEILQ